MFIRWNKVEALIIALEYSKEHLEYVASQLTYFDKRISISKSAIEMAVKKANDALKQVK